MKEWNHYKIDQRNKEDILGEIEEFAKSYTPEWQFDKKNPDAGSVIGMIFANQAVGNVTRFNQVLDKYRMEFANMYGVIPKPARPAKTIVTMEMSDVKTMGTHVKKGTQMLGEAREGEAVVFETVHDLYVTNAQISDMFHVSRKKASVNMIDSQKDEIELFHVNGLSVRNQSLILYHSYLFDGVHQEIKLCFQGDKPKQELAELFTNKKHFCFLYLVGQQFIPVEEVRCDGEFVILKKHQDSLKIEKNEQEMSMLVLSVVKPLQEATILHSVKVITENQTGTADIISDGIRELDKRKFLPFHHQPAIYSECYIGNDKIFAQKGSEVTLEFQLSFETHTVNPQTVEEEDLRIIKRKPTYQIRTVIPDCYVQDIAIDYYNGREYCRLDCISDVSEIFKREANSGLQYITFKVPNDWMPIELNGYHGRCLRIQVVRADNCFFTPVCYHYPIIQDLMISNENTSEGYMPEVVEILRGDERKDITQKLETNGEVEVFEQFPYRHNYWYIGFDRKLEDGPIGLFLLMKEGRGFTGTDLQFEYSTSDDFKTLDVIDHTNRFANSGVILFEPPHDMQQQTVEGKTCWWIRIKDSKNYFDDLKRARPILKNIMLNSVEALNIETQPLQEYTIEAASANMRFPLYADHILSAKVWVNEREQLSIEQMESLMKHHPELVQAEYNLSGEIEEFFALWKETESFEVCKAEERVYKIDRLKNEICFGDGKSVRIPQNTQGIAFKTIVLSCKGELGNILPGQIEGFQRNRMFISEVHNPIAAYGGSNMENLEATLHRGSNLLSGRKRLITEQDYLREIRMFSDVIADSVCICGQNISGETEEDLLNIVLLMRDYKEGSFSFRNAEQELKNYLLDSCEMAYDKEDIAVVQPIFVQISLDIWIEKSGYEDTYELRQKWMNRIKTYLEPIREDGTVNWGIGKLPSQNQIRRVLSTLEKEMYIKYLSIKAKYTDIYGEHEVKLSDLKKNPFMVCCNGTHRIYQVGSQGGNA